MENVCYDSIKSECENKDCPFLHHEEEELVEEIEKYFNAITEKCYTKLNPKEIIISLFPILEENLKDSTLSTLCLLKDLLTHPSEDLKCLSIEFFQLFNSDLRLFSKFFKKLANFLHVETLRLQFISQGEGDECFTEDGRLKILTTFTQKMKKLNECTLFFGRWHFHDEDLFHFFDNLSSATNKIKDFNMILEDSTIEKLFFFKPLFESNISGFSIRLLNCVFEDISSTTEKSNFFGDLFISMTKIGIKNLTLKQLLGTKNEFKIGLKHEKVEIEFSGRDLENLILNSLGNVLQIIRNFEFLRSFNLEVKLATFENYNYLKNFMKEIPKNFEFLDYFSLKILDKNQNEVSVGKINKCLQMIDSWIFLKKKTIQVLRMNRLKRHFRKDILYEVLDKSFLGVYE